MKLPRVGAVLSLVPPLKVGRLEPSRGDRFRRQCSQNDRFNVRSSTRKKDVDENRLLRTRPTFSQSVMVSVGVSKLGCTDIHFVEPAGSKNELATTIARTCLDRNYYPTCASYHSISSFNRTALLPIGHATLSVSCSKKRPTSYLRHCGRRILRT